MMDFSGVPAWMFPLLIWTLFWKAVASWKAARRGHKVWFVAFFVVNTFSILPIFYVVLMDRKEKLAASKKKKKSRKKSSKK